MSYPVWSELCRSRSGYVFRCVALAAHFFICGGFEMKKIGTMLLLFCMMVSIASLGRITVTAAISGDYTYTVVNNEVTITSFNIYKS